MGNIKDIKINSDAAELEASKKVPIRNNALINDIFIKVNSDASPELMHFSACMLLGDQGMLAYVPGEIVKPDFEEAVRLFVRAADAKYVLPHYIKTAAEIFEEGKYGQEKDVAKALHYYKKAAMLGDKRAIEKVKQLTCIVRSMAQANRL